MNYKISHPTKVVECEINLPSSKSISNRLLIIQALCMENFKIENLSISDDTINLQKAISSKENTINIGDAGTSFRFLTSYLSIQKGQEFILTGSDRMKERPIKELVSVLRKMGAKIEYLKNEGFPPLKIIGTDLEGGKIEIDGGISSQFITSILLIAPTFQNGINLEIVGELVSNPYVEMTLKLMKEFGIESDWTNNIITINHQKYIPKDYTVEADWSAASFWFEIASLSKRCNIRLNGLQQNSIQGDKRSIEIFNNLGVDSIFENEKLILTKNQTISPFQTYNLIETPDLYQPLRCTLFSKNIKADFSGIQTLKDKETDRIISVETELNKLNSIKIIDTHKDHRMAMSFAPLCLEFGKLQINDVEVVSKSYPDFWEDLKKAGFTISLLSD
ncbi:MAG: 3-phosphoshikimate 1-carboxyvinyltransferase [Flavobacteriales bacterium]|nr:3-phosphoshikimate 1-carboxyvinyltransferase [Flavobacteriales bacterium]